MGGWHARTYQRLGLSLAAVVDPDAGAGQRLARIHHCPHYSNLQEAIECESDIDLASITSPASNHLAACVQLLKADVHVLCEKPLSGGLHETTQLLELASERNLLLCPVHQFLFQRGTRDLLCLRSQLGAMVDLRFIASSAGLTHSRHMSPSELIHEMLPHPLSLMARLTHNELPIHWEHIRGSAEGLLAIGARNGVQFTIDISSRRRPTECRLEIGGTQKGAVLNLFHGYVAWRSGSTSRFGKIVKPFRDAAGEAATASVNLFTRSIHRESAYPGLRELIRQFIESIESQEMERGRVAPITPEEVALTDEWVENLGRTMIDCAQP